MASSSRLFEPIKVGNSELQHRIVMAPLTRFRADDDHVPLPFVKDYYAQRASVPGTLLIAEGTLISRRAGGYNNVPGIWSDAQIKAWKDVTAAVHAKGSFIYLQLWALGRVADPAYAKKHNVPIVGASPIAPSSESPEPKALTVEEIKDFVGDYAQAAKNAVEAGFDGVEVHGANGYLIDQFTQDKSNFRDDAYGGSVENRSRFGLEVAEAVVDAVGADKVGFRISPWSEFQGMKMADPVPQFSHLVKGLKALKLAYLHAVESRVAGNADVEATEKIDFAVDIWANQSPVFVAGGFTQESSRKLIDEEYKDRDVVVVFGRYFIANPDLPFRVKKGIPFTKYDRDLFYNAGEERGYTDYAFSEEWKQSGGKW